MTARTIALVAGRSTAMRTKDWSILTRRPGILEVGERGVAGAEIVERDPHPGTRNTSSAAGGSGSCEPRALGEFDAKAAAGAYRRETLAQQRVEATCSPSRSIAGKSTPSVPVTTPAWRRISAIEEFDRRVLPSRSVCSSGSTQAKLAGVRRTGACGWCQRSRASTPDQPADPQVDDRLEDQHELVGPAELGAPRGSSRAGSGSPAAAGCRTPVAARARASSLRRARCRPAGTGQQGEVAPSEPATPMLSDSVPDQAWCVQTDPCTTLQRGADALAFGAPPCTGSRTRRRRRERKQCRPAASASPAPT